MTGKRFIEYEEMQTLLKCLEHINNNVEFSIEVPKKLIDKENK